MVRAASFLRCGNDTTARVLQQQIADARERVLAGAEYPDTLVARVNLAGWAGAAGDATGGPRPVRRAAASPRVGVCRRAHPHPDQRAELAYWTGKAEGPAFWKLHRGKYAAKRRQAVPLIVTLGQVRAVFVLR